MASERHRPPVDALPGDVKRGVVAWGRELERVLGDRLVAALVYGAVARDGYQPGESEVEAVVVLKDAELETLASIARATEEARYAARIEPTVLTEAEVRDAADVFPLVFDEIQRAHILIAGRDVFDEVSVRDADRRHRIERELREARSRLRRSVLETGGAREALGGSVTRRLREVRLPLHALLRLKGIASGSELGTVVACASAHYGVDAAPLANAREAPEAAHTALARLLEAAILDVDRLR